MPYVYANGITHYYVRRGSDHPLLLIAGAGFSGWFWNKVLPGLSESYNPIVPDPRGTGRSDMPGGPYSVETLATDMACFLDRMRVRGAFVVGHALGAYVAQWLAIHRPELVGKLVLAAGSTGGPDAVPAFPDAWDVVRNREGDTVDEAIREIEASTAPGFVERRPDVVQELLGFRLSDAVPPEVYEAQVAAEEEMLNAVEGFETRLAQIQAPVLILAAEHDRIVPPANAERLAAHIPNAKTVILPDAGHLFPIEIPEATVQALADFLSASKSGE